MFRETVHRRLDHKANTPRRNLFLERRKQQTMFPPRQLLYPSWSVVGDCGLYSAGHGAGPCCLHPQQEQDGRGYNRYIFIT